MQIWALVKGTVQTDWICTRVVPLESPLKGHQPLLVLNFLISLLNIWNNSNFWAASCKIEPNLLLVRITVCIESCLHIEWRTVIWWENPPKCSSFLVRIAEWCNSLLSSRNPNDNWYLSPAFLELVSAKTLIRTSRRIRGLFAWSGSELWSCFKYSELK